MAPSLLALCLLAGVVLGAPAPNDGHPAAIKLVPPAAANEPRPAIMVEEPQHAQPPPSPSQDQWGRPSNAVTNQPSLLIAVVTAPGHKHARQAIRDTWARYLSSGPSPFPKKKIEIKFFIGIQFNETLEESIKQEAEQKDIVRLDSFTESYLNLTRKTLGIVSWAKDNGYDTVLKVDDDTFLRIDLLLEFLERLPSTRNVYSGHFQEHGWVIDNPESKWNMRDQYDEEIFPPYAFGPCYFLGEDMVDFIARHRYSLFPYRVEDAGVAIWTHDQLDLDRVEMPQLLYHANCLDAGEGSIFISPVNAKEMFIIQQNLENSSLCGEDDHPFVLEECQQHRCLCWPPPEDGPDCYSSFSNTEYSDVIPRL